jgi:hypothetical protein
MKHPVGDKLSQSKLLELVNEFFLLSTKHVLAKYHLWGRVKL